MEGRPLSFLAFDADRAAVRIHHVFDDLRAQSGSTGFAADRSIGEQTVANFRRHAFARIDDGEDDCGFPLASVRPRTVTEPPSGTSVMALLTRL